MEKSEKSPFKTSHSNENIPVFKGSSIRSSPDGGRAWLVAFAIFVVNFLIIGLGRVSGIFYVDYMEVFQVNRRTASTPFAVQQSIRNLFGPVVGILGQMFSVRALTMTGGLMAALSVFGCAYVPNIVWITIFWGDLYGIATAFTSTINQALINMYFIENRTSASGIAFAGGSLGAMVFPFFIETLLYKWGVQETYFTMAFLLLLIIPVAIVMKKPPWMSSNHQEIEWDKLIDYGFQADSRNRLYQGGDDIDHISRESNVSSSYGGKHEKSTEEIDSKVGRSRSDVLRTSGSEMEEMSPSSQGFVGKLFSPVVELLKDMFIEPVDEVPLTIESQIEDEELLSETLKPSPVSHSQIHTEDGESMPLLSKTSSKTKRVGFFGKVFGPVVDTLKEMFVEPAEEDNCSDNNSETDPRRVVKEDRYQTTSKNYGTIKNIDFGKRYSTSLLEGTGQEESTVPHEFERKVNLPAPLKGERHVYEKILQSSHSIPSSPIFTSLPPTFPSPYSSSASLKSGLIYEETFKQSGICVKAISPVKIPPLSTFEGKRKTSSDIIKKPLLSDVDSNSEIKVELSSATEAMRQGVKSQEETLVTEATFSREFSKFPSFEKDGVDEKFPSTVRSTSTRFEKRTEGSHVGSFKPVLENKSNKIINITFSEPDSFRYKTHSSPNEREEIKTRNPSPNPPQKFEVVVEKTSDNSPKHELKQKRIKTKRKVPYQKKADSCTTSVPVKDTYSEAKTFASGAIKVANPSFIKQKDADLTEIDFRFLHENIRYIMHIIRITESLLIESRSPKRFKYTASENREFESALEFFFYCLEETVPSKTTLTKTSTSSGTDSDIVFTKERLGSETEDGKGVCENTGKLEKKQIFDMSFTNRQIFDLLQVLFCQNESTIASHFPEQDQENVLKVTLELKKLIQHCHSIDSKHSTNSDTQVPDGPETTNKSTTESAVPLLRERTMYGESPPKSKSTMYCTETLIHKITDRPPSEHKADSSSDDTPPTVTLWDQIKVAIRLHKNPLFLLVCLCRVAHFFAFTGVLTIIVDYGVDRGLGMTDSVFLISALSLGDFVGRIFTGWITDMGILNMEIFMAVTMVLQGVLSMAFNWTPARYVYIITVVFSALQGAAFVRYPVLLCKYTKDYEHSVALGFSNLFSGILGFGMPYYIGYFRDTLGSYDQLFSINGGVCLLVGILWTFVPCYQRCSPP